MSQEIIFKILEEIAQDLSKDQVTFPTFLDVTFKIRTALKNPNMNIAQLAKLVSVEPLMSAKIIRMANSAALNPAGREVADVKTAIIRVGLEAVRTISFAVAMEQLIQSRRMQVFADLSRKLWDHTAHTAAIARILAPKIAPKVNPDEAMFAGMVHDIGTFYLLSRAEPFPELTKNYDALFDLLLGWHDNIGHALLSALGQPESILTAVLEHEQDREFRQEKTLSDVLFLANKLANTMSSWQTDTPDPDGEEIARVSQILDADTIQDVRERSKEDIVSLKQALGA